ncbi:MAG TPA: hypothetical protein VF147_09775 [Vicinamibacterales bacterium]
MRIVSTALLFCLCAIAATAQQLADPTHETTTPDVPGLTADASKCGVSTDPAYGTTKENPIKVGGGAAYMASRQVKYLNALRGPAGEGVHFKRAGSLPDSGGTFLDRYELDIKGERKTTLYLDGYHWSDPVAPVGFLCGAAMNLAPPGPDPFETSSKLNAIAVALGAAEVDPISIDADGSKAHGVVYDHVRLIAAAARASAATGVSLNPKALPQAVAAPHLVVIAGPMVCGGETVAPESVRLTDSNGNEPPTIATARGAKIAELSPGLPARDDAAAVAYGVAALIPGARTRVHYAKPCGGEQDVVLPVAMTAPRVLAQAPAPPPAGKTVPPEGAKVVMQIFVGADGSALDPVFVSGAYEFTTAAAESLKSWKFEPARVNGAPVYKAEQVMVVVK